MGLTVVKQDDKTFYWYIYMYFSNITEQDCSNTQETLSFIVNALVHFSRKLDDQGTTLARANPN